MRARHVGDEQIAQARRRAAAQQQAAGQGLGRRGHVAGDIHRKTRRDARARRFARARRALDALQPRQRVRFIGEQGRSHRRNVIAEPVAGIGAARTRIDGHPGNQGLRRQFIVGQQVAPQGAGAHAQHHVVDGRGGMQRLDPLEVAKGHHPRVEHFVRRQSGVEARRRHRVFPPAVRQRILRGPGQVRRRARQRPGDTQRRAQVVVQGAGQQRGQAGYLAALNLGRFRGNQGRSPIVRVGHAREKPHQRGAVHRGVVDFRGDGVAAARQALHFIQTLEHEDLPGRAVHIQRPAVIARHMDAELTPVTGLGQAGVLHVGLEVEVLVFDPVRVVELQRQTQQPAKEQGVAGQTLANVGDDVLIAHGGAIGHGRGIVDRHAGDVGEIVRRLGVEELGVLGA